MDAMKTTIRILTMTVLVLLTGCKSLPGQYQIDSWKNIGTEIMDAATPDVTKYKTDLAGQSSYTRTIEFEIPEHVCSADVFARGVEYSYTNSWNQLINNRRSIYELRYQHNQDDESAAHNFNLYANKRLDAERVSGFRSEYATEIMHCNYRAFTKGEIEGRELARAHYKEIRQKEI